MLHFQRLSGSSLRLEVYSMHSWSWNSSPLKHDGCRLLFFWENTISILYLDVSKNRWILPPKWMVKISWKTRFEQMDGFGGKHPYFWKHPSRIGSKDHHPVATNHCNKHATHNNSQTARQIEISEFSHKSEAGLTPWTLGWHHKVCECFGGRKERVGEDEIGLYELSPWCHFSRIHFTTLTSTWSIWFTQMLHQNSLPGWWLR